MTVKFNATGYAAGSSFSWNFGGGFTTYNSADSVKTNIFISSGSYSVSLRIRDASGNICTINKPSLIQVSAATSVSFRVLTPRICSVGDTAFIVNTTSGAAGAEWLTDGAKLYSNGDTLKYIYQTPGYKSVGLTITNAAGCNYSKTIDSAILVYNGIIPSFTAKQTTFCPPYTDSFFSTTPNAGIKINAYTWIISGTYTDSTTDSIGTYAFRDTGTFNLTLRIKTAIGCQYIQTKQAYLRSFRIIQPQLGLNKNIICNNDTLTLINNTPAGNGAGSFSLNLYGGINANKGNIGSGPVKVIYTKPGRYPVKISFKSSNCAADSLYDSVIVVSQIGTKLKSDSSIFCNDPDTLHFSDSSWTKPGTIVSKLWKVKQGTTTIDSSYTTNPSYFFSKKGKYIVSVTIQESNGCVFQANKSIVIDTPLAKAAFAPPNACPGDTVRLKDLTNPYTSFTPQRIWKILASDYTTVIFNDTNPTPSYIFTNPGQYYLALYTSNRKGCSDTTIDSTGILVGKPDIRYHILKDTVCAGTTVILKRDSLPIFPSIKYQWTAQHQDTPSIQFLLKGDSVGFTPTKAGYYKLKVMASGNFCADSLMSDSVIAVNGVRATYQTDSASACIPVTVRSKIIILENIHLDRTDTTCSYAWSSIPSGALFSGADSIATNITFNSGGCYNAQCEITNRSGCKTTVSGAFNACIGQVADFKTSKPSYCLGDTIFVSNKSKQNTGYKWFVKGSSMSAVFQPFDTSTAPQIITNAPGTYTIGLIAYTSYGCPDTTYQTVTINHPFTTISSPDSISLCGPTTVQFNTNTSGGVFFDWDFGDGSPVFSTTQTTIFHIYQIKQGKSSFDIKLNVRDKIGCTFTLAKKNFIQIKGPAPYFNMIKKGGCDSLEVTFVDSSAYVNNFFFFDGRGNIDSVFPPKITYHMSAGNNEYESFMPYMVGFDASGTCAIAFQPQDSLYIYRKPEALIYTDKKLICENQVIQFTSGGNADTSRIWYLNGLYLDTLTSFKYTFPKAGNYSVGLVSVNRFGCRDSINLRGGISVLNGPKAAFVADDTLHCLNDTVTFYDKTIKGAGVVSYTWKLYDSTQMDTLNGNPLRFKYNKPGFYPVSLSVVDSLGCRDSIYIQNYMHISSQNYAVRTGLRYLNVKDDQTLEIIWEKNPSPYFRNYMVVQDSQGMQRMIYQSTQASDTVYNYPVAITQYGRSIAIGALSQEQCSKKMIPDTFHKYIFLEADTFTPSGIVSKWNVYQGWGTNTEVRLEKFADYKPTLTINRPVIDTFFRDEPLCDSIYGYRISMSNGKYRSASNLVHLKSGYRPSAKPTDIYSVSVDGNYTYIHFDTSGTDPYKHNFSITRSSPGFKPKTISPVFVSPAADADNSEGKTHYIYSVNRIDYCGNAAPSGISGNNVVLEAGAVDDTIHLKWNAYDYWKQGVKHYLIYNIDPVNGRADLIGKTTDTFYSVNSLPDLISPSFCYQVAAIGNDRPKFDTSFSNQACVSLPAKIYVPSAFSPNNDSKNDIFKPVTSFIYNLHDRPSMEYHFIIYDRWGAVVFETRDPESGWDGTRSGTPYPSGMYFYRIQASPFSGYEKFQLNGQVMLLR